jgi:hypothetical protein
MRSDFRVFFLIIPEIQLLLKEGDAPLLAWFSWKSFRRQMGKN